MIFATDLDRTMVYSKKFLGNVDLNDVIEYQDGKIKGYITKKAENILEELKRDITVIPCTTRAEEQFKRIPFFRDCKFAICTNGAKILIDGIEDPQWKAVMQENLLMCLKLLKEYKDILEKQNFVNNNKVKVVDGYFLFFKTDNVQKCLDFLNDNVNRNMFYISSSNKKIYIFPSFVSKKQALRYLIDKIGDNKIVIAGDSDVDFQMMDLATIQTYIPLYEKTLNYTPMNGAKLFYNKGILAGEEILQDIKKIKDEEEQKNVN